MKTLFLAIAKAAVRDDNRFFYPLCILIVPGLILLMAAGVR